MRYGDDFIIITENLSKLKEIRQKALNFLEGKLFLSVNTKNDIIVKTKQGIKFLGVKIFPRGRRLNIRNWQRAKNLVNLRNVSSYSGLVKKHSKAKRIKEFNWMVLNKINISE